MRIKPVLVLSALLLAFCGREVRDTHAGGPGGVLAKVIMAANCGEEESVKQLFKYTLVADFDENMRPEGSDDWSGAAKRAFWEKLTKNRTVGKVLIRDEKISGDYAFVNSNIVYTDGSFKELRAELKQTRDGWVLMVYPAMLRR